MTNDDSNTLVYDGENHVTSATNSTTAGAYVYDGNGLRVQKCVPNCPSATTSTIYIFSGSKVLAEYDNGALPSAPSREYIYSGAALLARIDSSGTRYYHQDHLSNRLVTNSSGGVLELLGTFPFGEQWYNASADKLLFTTYERDSESGNDYAQARYNISRLARFSSPDPIPGSTSDPQSLNRYSYVRNMPVMLTDPLGLTPTCNTAKDDAPRPDYVSTGGPSDADPASNAALDPAAPQNTNTGCGGTPPWYDTTGGGNGISIDGGETFSPGDGAGGILGSSASTIPCPNTGCQLDANGNFIGPFYNPTGFFYSQCVSPIANPTQNCNTNPVWIPVGYINGIVGNQDDSDDQYIRSLGQGVVAGAGGIGDWRFIGGFYVLSAVGGYGAVEAGVAGLGDAAEDITTLSRVYRVYGGDSTQFGWPGGGSYTPFNPSEVPFYAQQAGLPAGNSAEFVLQGELPLRYPVQVRAALAINGVGGGLTEFVVANAENVLTWVKIVPF
jgi:RHS repeat-associated protein